MNALYPPPGPPITRSRTPAGSSTARKMPPQKNCATGKNLLLLAFLALLGEVTRPVFLLETLNATGRIDEFLLARVERMAHRANLSMDLAGRAAGLESVPATATNHYLLVFWMYVFLHNSTYTTSTLPAKPYSIRPPKHFSTEFSAKSRFSAIFFQRSSLLYRYIRRACS